MLACHCRSQLSRWTSRRICTALRLACPGRLAASGRNAAAAASTSSVPVEELAERGQRNAEASTSYGAAAAAASRDSAEAAADAAADAAATAAAAATDPEDQLPVLQLDLPPPENIRVKQAEFVKSSVNVADCPPPKLPEFAVIGRSNVGKSSLINMLTNRKSLALVSKEPGKTRCINHFIINNNWYLVDLPGYGYARTGKDNRRLFDSFTKEYFLGRPTLAMVLQLVDSSIPPQAVDLEYSAWLAQNGVPFTLVFTKHDKRKKGAPAKSANILAYKQALMQQKGFTVLPPSLVTSAAAGTGKTEVLSYLASLRIMFEQGKSKQ